MNKSVAKGHLVLWILLAIGSLTVPAHAEELTGAGNWQSISGESVKGTWAVTLARNGGRVVGSVTLTGSNAFSRASVSGEIDDTSIMLGVMVDGTKQASFAGKLDGKSVRGEWEWTAAGDHGVWYGTLGSN